MSTPPPPSRTSKVRLAVVALVAGVTSVQLFGVTFTSVPADAVPTGMRSVAQAVVHPYFQEEWKLFAPNPIAADRDMLVQAAWRDGDGVVTGEWVDLSAIDDAIVRHSVGAPRSAYLTGRLVGNADAAWSGVLSPIRTRVIDSATADDPLTTAALADLLEQEDVEDATAAYLGDVDLAAVTYATDVLRELEPDREIVAVRYGLQSTSVPTWDLRHEAEKVASDVEPYAWRTPATDDPERRRVIGDFLERNS